MCVIHVLLVRYLIQGEGGCRRVRGHKHIDLCKETPEQLLPTHFIFVLCGRVTASYGVSGAGFPAEPVARKWCFVPNMK